MRPILIVLAKNLLVTDYIHKKAVCFLFSISLPLSRSPALKKCDLQINSFTCTCSNNRYVIFDLIVAFCTSSHYFHSLIVLDSTKSFNFVFSVTCSLLSV